MPEKVVETKQCKHCDIKIDILDKDLEFYDKISPTFEGKKYSIPTPTLCPDCRNQRRLSWRNEGNLYRRKCDATGKDIVSMYSPDKKLIVWDKEVWSSDKCDVMASGLSIHFKTSFFNQYKELLYRTPLPNLTIAFESENSEYSIYSGKMKNCYMLFASWECEYSMYSSRLIRTSYVIDSIDGTNLERCYELINSENCFGSFYLLNSNNCQECYFSCNLENCNNCFLCHTLVGKKYCIKNKQYSKEKYIEKLEKIRGENFKKGWGALDNIILNTINKNLMMINCEESIGDNLKNCKNCKYCFHFEESENCKYSENGGMGCYNTYDGRGIGENLQYGYEILDTGINAINNYFLISCYTCNNVFYSINCHNSSYLFGCLGIKNKQYCIFNKQYTKEEYNKLVPKIIEQMKKNGEWGEFFPSNISLFGYNETAAMEYFPLTKKQIKGEGFRWSNYEIPHPKVEKIIPASKLPENISKIPDDILHWAIECEVTKKPFRIVAQELDFYRKNNIPVPRKHPNQRNLERIQLTNPKKIYDRNCDKCEINIKSVFSKISGKIVYCEECYNNEMY